LGRIVKHFYGLHLPHTATVFEALVLAILGQQIASSVARIIRTLLIGTYGPYLSFNGQG
jgi:3-methyladenine DNA glycosylase/8-oxoguanine DNA glycosylase